MDTLTIGEKLHIVEYALEKVAPYQATKDRLILIGRIQIVAQVIRLL